MYFQIRLVGSCNLLNICRSPIERGGERIIVVGHTEPGISWLIKNIYIDV